MKLRFLKIFCGVKIETFAVHLPRRHTCRSLFTVVVAAAAAAQVNGRRSSAVSTD